MSSHPNVILMVQLVPDDLARKTYRAMLEEFVEDENEDQIKIGNTEYNHEVMEEAYNESWQISAKEGSIVVFDMVTYGYGEKIEWGKLETQKTELENWAKIVCEKYHCSYKIFVGANHW